MMQINDTNEKVSTPELDPRPITHGENLAEDNDVLPDDDDLPSDRSQGTRSDLTLEESKRAAVETDVDANPDQHAKRI
jgi:hypothetical protein